MPGRGPRSSRRDPWRVFKYSPRAEVLNRAGGRCEGAFILFWGRCGNAAAEADHVFPYSKGGPTVVSNAQALCKSHNLRKGNMIPPWWYIRGLEKRRHSYFPEGSDVRVFAVMTAEDVGARERPSGRL
ncbi:HNH endonuclease [Demequina aurantiaca]|uniref:HNH endonuclease n=1 Tax=Demequina aurantiaca TaxID=676200 RepID=UPI003D34BE6E